MSDGMEDELAEAINKIAAGAPVDFLDEDGSTTLHIAAQAGQGDCVQLLIEAKANVHFKDADGASPLTLACQEGHSTCIEWLLQAGADPLFKCHGVTALTEARLSYSPQSIMLMEAAVDALSLNEEATVEPVIETLDHREAERSVADYEPTQPSRNADGHPGREKDESIRPLSIASAERDEEAYVHVRGQPNLIACDRAIQARMHAIRLARLRQQQEPPPLAFMVSVDDPRALRVHLGVGHGRPLTVALRGAAKDVESLSDGWAGVLTKNGRVHAISAYRAQSDRHSTVAIAGGDREGSAQDTYGGADGDSSDGSEEEEDDEEVNWLLASPSGLNLLVVRASRGAADLYHLDRSGHGRLRTQCHLAPPPDAGLCGGTARIEDATWIEHGADLRVILCGSALCWLFDGRTGSLLLSMSQADVIGVGVGRRISAVGATCDGRHAFTGSNNGKLIAWALGGPTAGHALHYQAHSVASFGTISRVAPVGAFLSDSDARLVSMQTSDAAGECVESVRVWTAAMFIETSAQEWRCVQQIVASGLAEVCCKRRLLFASIDGGRVGVWDIDSRKRCATLDAARASSVDDQGNVIGRGIADTATCDVSEVVDGAAAEWCLQLSRSGETIAVDCPGDGIALYTARTFGHVWSSTMEVAMVALGGAASH